jgi:uncharacterized membrane protein YczE
MRKPSTGVQLVLALVMLVVTELRLLLLDNAALGTSPWLCLQATFST